MAKLGGNQLYRKHYRDFVEDFAYGESLAFDEAIDSLSSLIARLNQHQATPLDKMAADYDEKAT